MKSRVFITGATAGFGEACAHTLANEGYDLILTGRRMDRLENLKRTLENETNADVIILCFDVRNETEVVNAIESLDAESAKTLGVLINNAGLAVGRGPIDEGDSDDWNRMIDTNVKGLLYVTRRVSPILKANGGGQIINIGSIAGKEVYPGGNVYCASKHAVDALSKAMRIDLLEHNIKVTNIAPGAAETEFSLVRFKGDESQAKDVYKGYEPLVANDIAEIVSFVLSRPQHVNLNDIVVMPRAQANSTIFKKD